MSRTFGAKLNGPRYFIFGNQLKFYSLLGSITSRCSGNEPALLPSPPPEQMAVSSQREQQKSILILRLLPQLDLGQNMRIMALSTAGVLIKSQSTGNYSFMYASQYFLSYKREDDKAWRRYHKNDVSVTVRYQPFFSRFHASLSFILFVF